MGGFFSKGRNRADSESSSSFMDKMKKDDGIPVAKVEVMEAKAVFEEPTDPETFYGQFNYPFIVGESVEDKALASRDESPDDRILDLLIIMDCTSSMSTWLSLCRKTLKDSIVSLQEENPDLQVRVAFLGYRDITDKDNIFVIQDFTFDVEQVKTLISETQARGGGDVPEDIQGALYQGLKLSWRKVSVKIAYLCTDAPCHGREYHSLRDSFPDGNPAGLVLEELMTQYSNKDIDFTTYELTGQTRNMYKMMETAYDEGSNKGQLVKIALEKEIKATEQIVSTPEGKFSAISVPSPPLVGAKPMGMKAARKMESQARLASAYELNFRNDLRNRASFQYAKHGWSKKGKNKKRNRFSS